MAEYIDPVDGIISRDPGPGKIVLWDADPKSSTYGHIRVVTSAQARHYRRAAWVRRIQRLVRWPR